MRRGPRTSTDGSASPAEVTASSIDTRTGTEQAPEPRRDAGRGVLDAGGHQGGPSSAPAFPGSGEVPLSPEVIDRGFAGDPARLRSFVAAIHSGLPADTVIGLRGSAVVGFSFETGVPFDAGGPGTSDLDVVVLGDEAMDLWVPSAQLIGHVNTLPLSDEAPWVAPGLDHARRRAQAIVGRPVSIQAMLRWFLDLRAIVQGQPYAILHDAR